MVLPRPPGLGEGCGSLLPWAELHRGEAADRVEDIAPVLWPKDALDGDILGTVGAAVPAARDDRGVEEDQERGSLSWTRNTSRGAITGVGMLWLAFAFN